jgi:predicted GH43/DUF377 family glycosyl hydrolase
MLKICSVGPRREDLLEILGGTPKKTIAPISRSGQRVPPLPKQRCGTASFALCVLAFSLMAWSQPPAIAASTQQVCADASPSPVIQDTGYLPYNMSNLIYSSFMNEFRMPTVLRLGNELIMWLVAGFNSTTTGIYMADSIDGRTWTVSSGPVLRHGLNGTWDGGNVLYPDVIWNGSMYLMYYVGNGGNPPTTSSIRKIGVAFSTDGTNWVKYSGNPIITHGPGQYDSGFTRAPSVVKVGRTYMMWYAGTSNITSTPPFTDTIDLATSTDGVKWMKYPGNPVFEGYAFNFTDGSSTTAFNPSVVEVNGTFVMAFGDSGAYLVGLASSPDGIGWSFSNSSIPLIGLTGAHNASVFRPSLLLSGNTLQLWFEGLSVQTSIHAKGQGGIWFANCGLLLAASPVTTTRTVSLTSTSTATSTSTVTLTSTATYLSTTTSSTMVTSTVTQSPIGDPAYLYTLVAAVAAALALGVALVRKRALV